MANVKSQKNNRASRQQKRRAPRLTKRRSAFEGSNEVTISGRDLVVPTPRNLPVGDSDFPVFQTVPANPTYWEGTRIQKIAQAYQLYRPLKFKVHYHPQVPVTNPGLVVYGTLYQDQATNIGALQQVLNTSNGGGVKECYSPFVSEVNVSDKFLQMRTYNTVGQASTTDNNPFTWMATFSGYSGGTFTSSSCPGWVEVEWTYRFVNGLPGPGNSSSATYVADLLDLDTYNTRMSRAGLPRINWDAPFGIPLGVLKAAAKPLLRHVSVLLLKESAAGSILFGIGKILNWVSENLNTRARDSSMTSLTDDTGQVIQLPDDTPVVVFQSGMPQPSPADPSFQLRAIDSFKVDFTTIGAAFVVINESNLTETTVNMDEPIVFTGDTGLVQYYGPYGQIRAELEQQPDTTWQFVLSGSTGYRLSSQVASTIQLSCNDLYLFRQTPRFDTESASWESVNFDLANMGFTWDA